MGARNTKNEMKRIFRLGTLAGVMTLACSCVLGLQTNKIPVNIGFLPVIGHDTRAQIEESVPFPQDRSFRIWATDMEDGSTVLDNETVSYGADGWLASEKWPETELLFTAYWPEDLVPSYDPDKGVSIKDFNTDEDKRDILVARNKAEYDADSLAVLNFDHILSRVDFRIMHSLEDHMEIVVTKIELDGYGFTGDYDDGEWTVDSKNDRHVVYDAGDGEGFALTKEATYIGEDFYTIPQLCQADIVVSFRVKVGTGGWIPDTMTVGSLKTDWQSGKQYTYTLTLADTRLTYTTGISNWNNRE